MRVFRRRLGTILMVGGVLVLVYAATVLFWRDPVTDVYTAYAQHELRGRLAAENREYVSLARTLAVPVESGTGTGTGAKRPATRTAAAATATRATAGRLAARFAHEFGAKTGVPIGRIGIPRIGLGTILVQSTDYWHSLTQGPGHYETTPFPGQGRTIGVAGHRTTWSAPFRHIDEVRNGDVIVLQMPYGRFVYRTTSHRVVKNNDFSILRNVGYEQLILSACHPLYSASHRWVVFARLVSITLPGASAAVAV